MGCEFEGEGEIVSGNIFYRKMPLPTAGHVVAGHTHNYDHTTLVLRGVVHVRGDCPDGRVVEKTFTAPDSFLVKAEVVHTITALEDNSLCWCVYSHRDAQGEVVQEYTGLYEAYE